MMNVPAAIEMHQAAWDHWKRAVGVDKVNAEDTMIDAMVRLLSTRPNSADDVQMLMDHLRVSMKGPYLTMATALPAAVLRSLELATQSRLQG